MRSKVMSRVIPLWINGMVAVGILGEIQATIFRDAEIKKLTRTNLGYYGWLFHHKERRELKAKIKARCDVLFEEADFDEEEMRGRFIPMS